MLRVLTNDVALFALMVPVQAKVRFSRTLDMVAAEPDYHPTAASGGYKFTKWKGG